MEDAGGSWSTGEFASLLDDLFDPIPQPTFRKTGQDTISGRGATTFKFDVTANILTGGCRLPGNCTIRRSAERSGSIAKLRACCASKLNRGNMPLLFPLAKVEEAVDYEFVRRQRPSHSCCHRLRSAELASNAPRIQP